MQCHSPTFLPCPLPFTIKPLLRTIYQPSSLSSSSPCSTATARDHSPLKLPSRGHQDHLISITNSLSSYVPLSSMKTFLRAHHVPCSLPIPWPLPPLGALGPLSSCPTALSDSLARLWLCFIIVSTIPQSKEDSPVFPPWPFFLFF